MSNFRFLKVVLFAVIALSLVCLSGCAGSGGQNNGGSGADDSSAAGGYKQISQEEAAGMMKTYDDCIIVDVRTVEEYESGHIPDAICIPNEEIADEMPAELPDKEQIILVYCRSGRRSKEASEKLAKMGYTNIYEFGGINDWNGETTVEE